MRQRNILRKSRSKKWILIAGAAVALASIVYTAIAIGGFIGTKDTRDEALSIQTGLRQFGFYRGPLTGEMDTDTSEALLIMSEENGFDRDTIMREKLLGTVFADADTQAICGVMGSIGAKTVFEMRCVAHVIFNRAKHENTTVSGAVALIISEIGGSNNNAVSKAAALAVAEAKNSFDITGGSIYLCKPGNDEYKPVLKLEKFSCCISGDGAIFASTVTDSAKKRALSGAAGFLSLSESELSESAVCTGKPEYFCFKYKNESVYVGRDGQILFYERLIAAGLDAIPSAVKIVSLETAAKLFLAAQKLGEVRLTAKTFYSGRIQFSFVKVVKGVLMMDEVIKISLDISTGNTVSFDLSGLEFESYDDLTTEIDISEAAAMLPESFVMSESDSAVISISGRATLTFRFVGKLGGIDVVIYTDAVTGKLALVTV